MRRKFLMQIITAGGHETKRNIYIVREGYYCGKRAIYIDRMNKETGEVKNGIAIYNKADERWER